MYLRLSTIAVLTGALLAAGGACGQALQPTTATGIGVWYQPGAPAVKELWRPGDPGERLILKLIVRDTAGAQVSNVQVELWQADGDGAVHADRYRTRLTTAKDGTITVSTALPGYIWRARHIHLVLTHANYRQLITRILFRGDPLLAEMEYPELAIALEQGRNGDETMLFGTAELVLTRDG